MTKRCPSCGENKAATTDFFYRNRSQPDGLQIQCKECQLEAQRNRRKGDRKRRYVPRKKSKPDQDGQRYCYHCEQWKPLDNDHFKPTRNTRAGFSRQCWACIQARRREARRESWANRLRGYAMCRHKKYDRPCNLTVKYIETMWDRQKGLCAWFQIPMIQDMDSDDRLRLVTLDRIDSSKGYTKDNTVLVCKAANQCRGNTPMESFEIFLQEVRAS